MSVDSFSEFYLFDDGDQKIRQVLDQFIDMKILLKGESSGGMIWEEES